MVGVVPYGTGVRRRIPGVTVAGKTGTAELESTVPPEAPPARRHPPARPTEPPGSKTDAWFAGFAPVRHPRIAVCVMLVRAGAGGDTAAPAAATVLGRRPQNSELDIELCIAERSSGTAAGPCG